MSKPGYLYRSFIHGAYSASERPRILLAIYSTASGCTSCVREYKGDQESWGLYEKDSAELGRSGNAALPSAHIDAAEYQRLGLLWAGITNAAESDEDQAWITELMAFAQED